MAFTKDTQDTLTILPSGVFEHLRVTRVFEDGELLAERNHRTTYTPDMDTATLPNKIGKLAAVVWTTTVVNEWKANELQRALAEAALSA